MRFLDQIARLWQQHREFRAVLAELRRMSDRELNDLGIARCDISRLAYEEAERRMAERAGTADRPRPARSGEASGVRHAFPA